MQPHISISPDFSTHSDDMAVATIAADSTANRSLQFKRLTLSDAPAILPMLAMSPSRTCDYTLGVMLMWADYFHYQADIINDTLFVKGVTENDITHAAFSLPVGRMPLNESLDIVRSYCNKNNITPILSAVPADRLEEVMSTGPTEIEELTDWADYLYDIESMATFRGKKLSKKRNHVNRFVADNPDAVFRMATPADIPGLIDFVERQHPAINKSITAEYERLQTIDVLRNLHSYPGFECALLTIPDHGPVAFTVGEIIGDTLYAHIEKIDHDFNGAGETVSSRFCAKILELYPGLRYVNREEDTGDLGLRKAKMEYHPLSLLKKYNITLL